MTILANIHYLEQEDYSPADILQLVKRRLAREQEADTRERDAWADEQMRLDKLAASGMADPFEGGQS